MEKIRITSSGRTVTDELIPPHPLLDGCVECGRGESSIVFDKGDDIAVYKVVMCPASYAFLTSAERPVGSHYPIVFADHGVIGKNSLGFPMHLLEMEKLYPLPDNSEAQVLAKKIHVAYLEGCQRWSNLAGDMGKMALYAMTRTPLGFSMDMQEALSHLSSFVQDFQAIPDLLSHNNIMMRKDGTLVFSDPVFLG